MVFIKGVWADCYRFVFNFRWLGIRRKLSIFHLCCTLSHRYRQCLHWLENISTPSQILVLFCKPHIDCSSKLHQVKPCHIPITNFCCVISLLLFCQGRLLHILPGKEKKSEEDTAGGEGSSYKNKKKAKDKAMSSRYIYQLFDWALWRHYDIKLTWGCVGRYQPIFSHSKFWNGTICDSTYQTEPDESDV